MKRRALSEQSESSNIDTDDVVVAHFNDDDGDSYSAHVYSSATLIATAADVGRLPKRVRKYFVSR